MGGSLGSSWSKREEIVSSAAIMLNVKLIPALDVEWINGH